MLTQKEVEEQLWCEIMEDYVITAELGHLAKDQKVHKEEMRQHYQKLLSFISQIRQSDREAMVKQIMGNVPDFYSNPRKDKMMYVSDILSELNKPI